MLERLRRDLTAAQRARDEVAVSALRSVIAAIENAAAVDAAVSPRPPGSEYVAGAAAGWGATEVDRRELADDELRDVVRVEVEERRAAAAEYDGLGRGDVAERLRREADLLVAYL